VDQVLTRQQAELVAAERRLVLDVRDALAQADGPPADLERLAALVQEMDELFLLVVAGEYNAGKSTFINALLGDEVFAMGDLPTTRAISILRYGEPAPPEPAGEHVRVYRYPLDALRDLEIVDTPGTNSIERMEEEITRGFVPRADLVLFVTSLLQPLTASELGFLTLIREWGKKVIFVVNGVDRRNGDEQLDRVRAYLTHEVTTRLGGPEPPVYMVSALRALRAKVAARGGPAQALGASGNGAAADAPDPRDEFAALERYLLDTLRQGERVRLKLLSPVGVLRRVLDANTASVAARRDAVRDDAQLLRRVRDQLAAYSAEMRTDSERYLLELRAALADVERRGRTWLERNIRVGNINLLRNRDAVENRFRGEVVADAPRQIEDVVHRMVDWTVGRNLKLWTAVFAELDAHTARLRASGALGAHGDSEFQYNREELFTRLRQPVERRLEAFNAEAEAREVVESMREASRRRSGSTCSPSGSARCSSPCSPPRRSTSPACSPPRCSPSPGGSSSRPAGASSSATSRRRSQARHRPLGAAGGQVPGAARALRAAAGRGHPAVRALPRHRGREARAGLGALAGARGEVDALERRIVGTFPDAPRGTADPAATHRTRPHRTRPSRSRPSRSPASPQPVPQPVGRAPPRAAGLLSGPSGTRPASAARARRTPPGSARRRTGGRRRGAAPRRTRPAPPTARGSPPSAARC
jgi:GTP-binding protein EngB required for normal cell division